MNAIQKTNPEMSGKNVRRFFRQVANIIPANALCYGALDADDYETHAQFMFGETIITLYMTKGGAL